MINQQTGKYESSTIPKLQFYRWEPVLSKKKCGECRGSGTFGILDLPCDGCGGSGLEADRILIEVWVRNGAPATSEV